MRTAATAAAVFTILPRHVLGGPRHIAPSDRVNIAGVGVGGMGRANMQALSSQNLVAMCDVDWSFVDNRFADIDKQLQTANQRAAEATDAAAKDRALQNVKSWSDLKAQIPKTKRYTDYREMLAKQKNIDAVVIATPDHTHAIIALAAMDLGKHVYVQKPLAWSVEECRRLAKRATETKLQTQMGNQGHSSDDARLVNEYIQSGAIGTVTEVHVWTTTLAYWRGHSAPCSAAGQCPGPALEHERRVCARSGIFRFLRTPDKLAWDLFLGPSRFIEYHPIYHPFNWRGWTDWGVGAIGDMGAHLIDSSFWSLDLDYPTSIETTSTPTTTTRIPWRARLYEFPAKGARPP